MPDNPPQFTRLDSRSLTLVLALTDAVPAIVYCGQTLPADLDLAEFDSISRPGPLPGELDAADALTLLPETGTGFAAHPGIAVHRRGREGITQLATSAISVERNRIRVEMADTLTGIAVAVTIVADHDSDVFRIDTSVDNTGDTPLEIDWLAAVTWPVPAELTDVSVFTGRWAGEFQWQRQPLGAGIRRENRSGRSSHASFPGLLLSEAQTTFERGRALALHLAWSGNHRLLVERTRDGRVFVQAGEWLQSGEIELAPGERYRTPRAFLTLAERGFNETANRMHDYVRAAVCPPASTPRPVHFNTWEACYFAQDEATVLSLIERSAALGAERFVLDDGWFRGRNDAASALGDWDACPVKYPRGLEPLIEATRDAGMQFGLWLEPEMISENSALWRDHPDWYLGDARRRQPLGRNQFALNLTRGEVRRHVAEQVGALIRRYDLGYIKWDMNRDLTHVVGDNRPVAHAMTAAFYELLDEIRQQHPDTEIEICASGGARSDYGALSRGNRLWASDVHDPLLRQQVQRGIGQFFPPEVTGAHVGCARDEITGRRLPMSVRAASVLCLHAGIELDPRTLDDADAATLVAALAFHKRQRHWLHSARSYFVDYPEPQTVVRLQLSRDGRRALACAVQLDQPGTARLPSLRLQPLAGRHRYVVRQLDAADYEPLERRNLSGDVLAGAGLVVPALAPASVALWLIEREDDRSDD
ncbi:MAG: alpha-galactosidase [Pseudomonadota bacterium]